MYSLPGKISLINRELSELFDLAEIFTLIFPSNKFNTNYTEN